MSIEKKETTKENSFVTFAKDACQTTKDDITQARKNGDQFAKDLVEPLHLNKNVENVLQGSASLMSQMVAGGVTLLMCPMKILSKEL